LELTDIIDRFRGPLIGLIVSWGANYIDAAEIAQDSLADAYLNRDSCLGNWQEPEVFGAWLRGFARNHFRNAFRSKKRREKRVISVAASVLEATPNRLPTPVDERLERLRDAIEALPMKMKQAVIMHYLETTTVKDVAALLSVPPKTIEGRLYQARRELKRMIGENWTSGILKALLL
jgi:RNA polymerase sigma factor (sigma-70 family)